MNSNICKDRNLCTGCTACVNVCPQKCIEMIPGEDGFSYPRIDESRCIHCGLCERICPANKQPEKTKVKAGYVARTKDMENVNNSTSGGMCAAFADYTFSKDGLLYGVGYDENMKVRHFGIDVSQKERVKEMRGSKYVQSDLGTCFSEIKAALDQDRFVCFTGTPCQVAGLKAFLRKDYQNLLTIDLVCHGVSSPMAFRGYVGAMSKRYNSKVTDVRFRNKTYGYHSGTMRVDFENGKKYYGSGRIDQMSKAYFLGACSRECCYQCPFKGDERYSDFTIFDSWHVDKLISGMKDDDKGYTNVFVHTEKGMQVWNEMKKELDCREADPVKMKEYDGVMIDQSPSRYSNRDILLQAINESGFEAAMNRYLPITAKDKLVERTKKIFHQLGIMRLMKKMKEVL